MMLLVGEKPKKAAKAVLDFEVGGTKRYSLYTKHDANDFKDPLTVI